VFGALWQDLETADDAGEELGEEAVDLSIATLPPALAAPVLPPPDVKLPSRARRTSARRAAAEIDDPELLFASERRAAILRGNLTHQVLCALTRNGDEPAAVSVAERIERELPLWHQEAMARGLGTELASEVARATAEGVTRVTHSELGQWCVLEPNTKTDPDTRTRWIIDYKTAQPADGLADLTAEHWLQAEIERYAPQLDGYARALTAIYPHQRMRKGLYFTAIDEFWELGVNSTDGTHGTPGPNAIKLEFPAIKASSDASS